MAKQVINVGLVEGDKTGDKARDAFIKVNENFDELYTAQESSSSTPSSSSTEEPKDIYDFGHAFGARAYSKTVSIFDQIQLENYYGIDGLGEESLQLLNAWYGGNAPPNTSNYVDFLLIPTSETEVAAIFMDNYEQSNKVFTFNVDADELNEINPSTRNDVSSLVGVAVNISWAWMVPDPGVYNLSGDFTLKTQEYIQTSMDVNGAFGYDNINIEGLKYTNSLNAFEANGMGMSTAPKFIFKDLLFATSITAVGNEIEAPKLVWLHSIVVGGASGAPFDISLPSLKYIGSHKKTTEVFYNYESNNSSLSLHSLADENQSYVDFFQVGEINFPSLVSLSCTNLSIFDSFTNVVFGTTDTLKYVRPGIDIYIEASFDPSALDNFFITLAGVLDYFNWCSTSTITMNSPTFTEPLEAFGSSAEAEAAYYRMLNAGLTYNF